MVQYVLEIRDTFEGCFGRWR